MRQEKQKEKLTEIFLKDADLVCNDQHMEMFWKVLETRLFREEYPEG